MKKICLLIICLLFSVQAFALKTYYQYDRSGNYIGKYTIEETRGVKTTKYYNRNNQLTRRVVENDQERKIYNSSGKLLRTERK